MSAGFIAEIELSQSLLGSFEKRKVDVIQVPYSYSMTFGLVER